MVAQAFSARDPQSESLIADLRRKWRDEVKYWAPEPKKHWVGREGRILFGVEQSEAMVEAISAEIERYARQVPSMPWLDEYRERRVRMPIPATEPRVRVGAVRMRLSRGEVRIGEEGKASRRWTPPQCVDLEDMLDCMSIHKAEYYSHPPSPSAVAIHHLLIYGRH